MDSFWLKTAHQLFAVLGGTASLMEFTTAILCSYVVTLVLTGSSLFSSTRFWISDHTPWLVFGDKPHPVFCRLCLGAWISLAFSLIYGTNWLMVWAASYFMATQERT